MDENKMTPAPESGENTEKRARKMSPSSKRGMYTAAISALVVAIVIVFNLVIGGLPDGTLEFDITGKDLYTVTAQSVDYLKTLDKDVNVIVLAQSGAIDQHLQKFINNYAKLSSHIKLQIIDPVLDPTALTKYNAKENNVVVSCDATGKNKILSLGGFQGYSDGLILYDPTTYQYYNQLKPVALDAEGQLTSAVGYVTSEAANKLYLLGGHDEAALGSNASSLIAKANIETASLNLLTDGGVPDDCQLIVSYNPARDLSDDELSTLETYLKNGGKLLLLIDNAQLKNFNVLMEVYGLQMQSGTVGDDDRYYKYYYQQYGNRCIDPVLSTGSDVTTGVSTDAIVRSARGLLQITPGRRAATVTPFMSTSENGVLIADDGSTAKGTYILGATAIETFADKADVQTRLTVISAIDLISDQIPMTAGFSNYDIFMNAVNKNYSDVQSVSVPSKSLEVTPTKIGQNMLWGIALVSIIPFVVLGGGFVYWNKRRNR
ncbi:ABC-2 type transport system permease protein [Sporobacter termitidis DSM 10068]|uniref:ABC-2 type transport system permease protein n=1 Tax=Sporobacter termitidis DSM 10068 TaxID=1123282 RepID=A0A1M5VPL9_9FIRM|nr:Gldg family protein [Sporobacter termitidis]SHH77175.1 ABC-2 type transport system permease protein [Sporobacter termitidis DSM 10068]